MSRANPAPVLRDAWRLSEWVLQRFEREPGALAQRLCATALDLVESLVLALRRADAADVELADDRLALLRAHLRLARDRALLDDRQLIHALELCNSVGRQLGGWLRQAG